MCEISVIDPEQCNLTVIHQLAAKFHEEQGDGIGVVAVKNKGDKFEYDAYKSAEPHWQTFYAFLRRNLDNTWRFVLHGRNATAGDVNRDSAHPIYIDCEQCEFDWVIHNGSVRDHRDKRDALIKDGHAFNTKVDSELIAHSVSRLPHTIEDHAYNTYSFFGNLNYLLFSEDGILVRARSKYHLTEYFTMTCSIEDFEWDEQSPEDFGFERSEDNEWMLINPGDEEPDIEVKERPSGYTRSSKSARQTPTRGDNWFASKSENRSHPQQGTDDEVHTEEYTDLVPNLTGVVAFYAAPDTICVIDNNTGERDYIRKWAEPRLFYWYAAEEPPTEIEKLEARADQIKHAREKIMEGGDWGDFPAEKIVDIAATHAGVALARRNGEEGTDLEEAEAIQEEVRESIKRNVEGLEGAIS